MRVLTLGAVAVAFCIGPTWLAAQSIDQPSIVETVISAGPQPDKSYKIAVVLRDGRRLSLEIPPAEAIKIVNGISAAAGLGAQKQQIVTVVHDISIQADSQGRLIILVPRSQSGPLEPLGIPVTGADQFIQLFQQKAAETRANAMRH
jgi:hypothetical protein